MANSQRGMQKVLMWWRRSWDNTGQVSNLRGQLKRGDSLKTTALKLPSLGPVEVEDDDEVVGMVMEKMQTVTHKRKDNSSNLSEKVLQDGSVFRGHLKGVGVGRRAADCDNAPLLSSASSSALPLLLPCCLLFLLSPSASR
eukprot:752773-Hanusia_phi.AAC.2